MKDAGVDEGREGWLEVAVVATAGTARPPLATQVGLDPREPLTWHELGRRGFNFYFLCRELRRIYV
jgi:hypothetical protein